jgi:hypothetical protein
MKKYIIAIIMSLFVALFGCEQMRVRNGLTRKSDSLFLGFYLGMDRKAFYEHCWEMNKNKVFTHGPTNQSVEYNLLNELEDPVTMRFYPTFYEEMIFEMPVTFTYQSWAPWNKQYWADTLLVHMLPVFKRWYGENFKEIDHPTMGKVYYKIDGKRRINLFKKDDQFVQAVFTDLKIEKELKDAYRKKIEVEQDERD